MCDYANYLERKARNEGISQGINQGKKIERKEKNIEYVRKLMERLQMSFKEAINLLEIPEKEVKEMLFLWISQDNKRRKDSTNL